MKFSVIAAVDRHWGIARDGAIPWADTPQGKADMWFFKDMTTRGASPCVIMGRRTYESLPAAHRPLPNRRNIVVGCDWSAGRPDCETAPTLDAALDMCGVSGASNIWVIGGAQLYQAALLHPRLDKVYISTIEDVGLEPWNCDTFFPAALLRNMRHTRHDLRFVDIYECNNLPEEAYLRLLGELLTAPLSNNRTGILTHSLFAQTLRFPLYDDDRGAILPLLTTKRVPYKLVLTELLWFISGRCTNVSYLHKHGNRIWDDNTSREFLDSRGLSHYNVGDTGPIYGAQWRTWESNGVQYDQLRDAIETLKRDPTSRRIIVSAWNVAALANMALPPCHWNFQFMAESIVPVTNTRSFQPAAAAVLDPYSGAETARTYRLNCCMTMRSADMALGVPFNIASYATLTHIAAQIVGMVPGTLVINMTDCHMYSNHVTGVMEQIQRRPFRFPKFRFGPAITEKKDLSIDDFCNESAEFLEQFIVQDYVSHPAIKFKMAV